MRGRFALVLLCASVVAVFLILRFSPYPELDAYVSRSYGLVINDRNGVTLRVVPAGDGVKREWAGLEKIPAGAVQVLIRAEDRRFYVHPGVDLIAIAGSAYRNIRSGKVVSGASTITMQLARLVRPHGKGLKGKILEASDALRLEARLSKKNILELWLNGIPFGSNIEGLPAMTRARFGRPVAQLDDVRSALLAAAPRRPALYDPALNREAAVREALILSRRLKLAFTEAELWNAAGEAAPLGDRNTVLDRAPFHAPHFTERLLNTGEIAPSPVIRTTLDLGLQEYAEKLLQYELASLADNRVSNGAILVVENSTGAVRVYAGSLSWFDDEHSGKIDGVRIRNQPGSCLKPFLYALALDQGFSPADILPDIPSVFGGSEAYIPSNFNRRFNGPVRFRVALASSLNIPAVYLLERLGVRAFEEYLVSLGFDSIASRMGGHGAGLALGNAEVSLEELVRAFSAFPRGGLPASLVFIEEGGGSSNTNTVQINDSNTTRAMSPYAAWLIADMLSDRGSRFTGFGPAPALATEFPAMFKTGTANQYQHIWALGATRRFTVGVWMGNFSGDTVIGRTGSSIPARIASQLLAALEEREGQGRPPGGEEAGGSLPAGIEEREICSLSGMRAGPYCPGKLREWFRPAFSRGAVRDGADDGQQRYCSWHRGRETVYPREYRAWLAERRRAGRTEADGGLSGGAYIRLPVEGAVFYLDPSQRGDAQAIRIEAAGFGAEGFVYVDGALAGRLNSAGVFVLPLTRGRHQAFIEDDYGARAGVRFEVR
ncbi:MAG: penicillin-binding protein 1C [Treponema sp.]|jgi:penicillin-binding protein 1C|nr:penicillin-binding protein 1C [Treponema sp.]